MTDEFTIPGNRCSRAPAGRHRGRRAPAPLSGHWPWRSGRL